MGIPRPKRLPHAGTNRAAICRTRAALSDDLDVGGNKPQCLLYVRNYCDAMRRLWYQCRKHTGLAVVETVEIGDADEHGHCKTLVVRAIGTPDQLESAVMYGCIERWEYVMNARVPLGERHDEAGIPYVLKVTAQGAGPEKTVPSKPKAPKPGKVSETQHASHAAARDEAYHQIKYPGK